MVEMHTVIWAGVVVVMTILGWFARAILIKKNDITLRKLYDQQAEHRYQMDQHCKNSEDNSKTQIALLNETCRLLGTIIGKLDNQIDLAKQRKDDQLAEAIQKLAAKIK